MEKDKGKNKRRGGIENIRAHSFKKGETGNPNGRPKGQRNYATIYREALIKLGQDNGMEPDEIEKEMVANAILLARKGNVAFYKDTMDRIHGQPVAKQETEVKMNVVIEPTARLKALAKKLNAKKGKTK